MKKAGIATAIFIGGVAVVFAFLIGTIALRLHRNQPAARTIAGTLASQYPNYRIIGAASYESEVIYINVWGQPDEAKQIEIRDWLANEKNRRQLAVRGLVKFVDPKTAGDIAEFDF